MATSLIVHPASDGTHLQAVLSLAVVRSLNAPQIQALHSLGILRVSDLLHYAPVHNARLVVAAAQGRIAHDFDLATLIDASAAAIPLDELPRASPARLKGVGEAAAKILLDEFNIRTIEALAEFGPFREAQRFLTASSDVFREPASAPDELMPRMVGHVETIKNFSSFVREDLLRLRGLQLTLDDEREVYLDLRLASLFVVRGLGPIFRSNAFGAPVRLQGKVGSLGLPTIPTPTPEVQLGYVTKLSQRWVNLGVYLGEIKHSLALAPGESRNIAIIDWQRRQRTARQEDTQVNEQLSNLLIHTRALEEVTRSTAWEHQYGGTEIAAGTLATSAALVAGAALVGAASGALVGLSVDALTGFTTMGLGTLTGMVAGGAAGAIGASAVISGNGQLGVVHSDSTGDREINGEVMQNIAEMTSQKASSVRSLFSNVFVTDEQAENEQLTTHNITNYNHSHALTIQYFEVLQHYRAELSLTAADALLYLPYRPLEFSLDLIQDYWDILRRAIPDPTLLEKFDSILQRYQLQHEPATDEQAVSSITVMLRLGNLSGLGAHHSGSLVEVQLLGDPLVQRRNVMLSGTTQFDFRADLPDADQVTGVQVFNLFRLASVEVLVHLVLVNRETGQQNTMDFSSGPLSVNPTGNVTFEFAAGSSVEPPSAAELDEVVRYFNARRYFFTQRLLLAIEREQLVDVIEALMFTQTIDFDGLGRLDGPDAPPSGLHSRSFWPRNVDPGQVLVEAAAGRIRALVIRVLSVQVTRRVLLSEPLKAAIGQRVEQALLEAVRRVDPQPADYRGRVLQAVEQSAQAVFQEVPEIPRSARADLIAKIQKVFEARLDWLDRQPGIAAGSVHLTEFIHPEPLAITSNTLIFKMRRTKAEAVLKNPLTIQYLSRLVAYPEEIRQFVKAWPDSSKNQHRESRDIFLPTAGVFAEAILGRSNASEKVDATRFYNWQDSPIPHQAPAINPLEAGGRAREALDTTPTVPGNVLNIVNPAAFPDPVGLAASLAAVQNGNIFRDMSKTEQLTTVLGNLSKLAEQTAQMASTLAGDAREQALQSATDLASQVAEITGQLAQQPGEPPNTPTKQAGAVNLLDALKAEPNPLPDLSEDPRARTMGVPPPPVRRRTVSPPPNQRVKIDLEWRVFAPSEAWLAEPDAALKLAFSSFSRHATDHTESDLARILFHLELDPAQANMLVRQELDESSRFGSAFIYKASDTVAVPQISALWARQIKPGVNFVSFQTLQRDEKNMQAQAFQDGSSVSVHFGLKARPYLPETTAFDPGIIDVISEFGLPVNRIVDLLDQAVHPEIDASVVVEFFKDGNELKYRMSGHHDGFPSSRLLLNGVTVYDFDPRAGDHNPPLAMTGTGLITLPGDSPNEQRVPRTGVIAAGNGG